MNQEEVSVGTRISKSSDILHILSLKYGYKAVNLAVRAYLGCPVHFSLLSPHKLTNYLKHVDHEIKTRPQTYDGYSALHIQHSVYLNGGMLSVNPECRVLTSVLSLGPHPKLMTITQNSTLKTPDSAPCIRMGNLKCGRIHIPSSDFPFRYMDCGGWSADSQS